MNPNRNSPCPCGSKKKFKNCCIELYHERLKWNGLEEGLRKKVQDYWEEFYSDKYTKDAILYFDKDIDWDDINERRLFFDWFIHDYVIKENGKSVTTIIQRFVKDCHDHLDEQEKKTSELWADSASRFYEVSDIKKGSGYTITDVFDNQEKHLFMFDRSSSFTISKYDILYTRLYYVGDIIRNSGSLIVLSRRFLPVIKEYVRSSFKIFVSKRNKENKSNFEHEVFDLNDYYRKESLSLIKYMDSLKLQPVITTAQGDLLVISRSSFLIKNKKRLLYLLENSKYFVELENEGNVLRYDWVKELEEGKFDFLVNDAHKKYNNNHDKDKVKDKQKSDIDNLSEEIALNTILWVSKGDDGPQEHKDISDVYNSGDSSGGIGSKNEGRYIPYQVLGNLSINGKILEIECLSDSLLYQCNDLIQSLAGKYLEHVGNVYKDISSSGLNAESTVDFMDAYEHYPNNSDDDDDDLDIGESDAKEIERSFKKMLENYYENWIKTKIPSLGNKTPLQAAKTKKGKELVRELLKVMENDFARNSKSDLPPFPFEKVKERLDV
ncbi:MAG: SEC-C metal-binding domain-containing protein [Candidatus Nitrosocosmicus sp.]